VGVGILRTIDGLASLVGINPGILDNFNLDEMAKALADANGVPAKLENPPEMVAQIRADRAKQQQMAQMIEAAPQLAGAAKDAGLTA
jgi:hypothetical protein